MRIRRALEAATLAAAGGLAYGAGYEVRAFRLRRVAVPVLPSGAPTLRVLHLSDLHVTPSRQETVEWVRGLDALAPDLVVNTGDNLAHRDGVPVALKAYQPLLARPGVFVFGSNDYYAPKFKNPARYLVRDNGRRIYGAELPWRDLRHVFIGSGWQDLTNAAAKLTVAGVRLGFRGVDDPHLDLDDYASLAGPLPAADLSIGVTHTPQSRVLDAMESDGHQLIVAGHTHGGQLCVPGFGALVTNCDLPRRQAKGLSRWGRSWLHVSAGLGTSPYAPVRFACPPEATLLTLRPHDAPRLR